MASDGDIYCLTQSEAELMIASKGDPNLWASYWLQKPGFPAFQFDKNFTERGKWQVEMILASQKLIVAIAGVGTGKTLGVGLGAFFLGSVTPDFRFANIGHELDQSKIMYDVILDYVKGTRAEKLIIRKPSAPHPKIEAGYKLGDVEVRWTMEFYSAGEDQSGENVFSKRYDWINIEEAFRFDNLRGLVSKLRTRLTGSTSTGRPLLARLSIISNPIENPELFSIAEDAEARHDHAVVFWVDTEDNKNVTKEQIDAMLEDIPEEERAMYLKGIRPEGRGVYFSKHSVDRASSQILSAELRDGIVKGLPGFRGNYTPSLGYYDFRFPRKEGAIYIQLGDPGTGAAPARNAPTIGVWEVDPATNMNILRALWWGNGNGNIMPFVHTYLELLRVYSPEYAAIDSTSTQKYSAQIMNVEYVVGKGFSVSQIDGMDFSGGNKFGYLVSLRVTMDSDKMVWPDCATGLGAQLKNYDPFVDIAKASKLAQDLVAMAAMAARASRALYPPAPPEEAGQSNPVSGNPRDERLQVGTGMDRDGLRAAR